MNLSNTNDAAVAQAKATLSACVRHELRDHAFGDAEISWVDPVTKQLMAEGYFGRTTAEIFVGENLQFTGDTAQELRALGVTAHYERNDETGPDEYVEGQTMPGLTKEGVLEEITTPPKPSWPSWKDAT